MIRDLPKAIILTFLVTTHTSLVAKDVPILLNVTGNQQIKVAAGETINLYVRGEASAKGKFSLEIKPQAPSFASNWDTKTISCKSEKGMQNEIDDDDDDDNKGGCVLTDTLTLSPSSLDCGKYDFVITAQLSSSPGFAELEHHVSIEVGPKMIAEPPFTTGISNLICWDSCDPVQEELVFFPGVSQAGPSLAKTTAEEGANMTCRVIENLSEGVRYGYYIESTVLMSGNFVSLQSDTTFSTQDNTPPPEVTLHDFTVNSFGDVTLRWRHLPDAIGVIDRYVLHRRNQNTAAAFAVVDTIPFFPATVKMPLNYSTAVGDREQLLYVDSDEVITRIPDIIKGSTLIRTAVDDRWEQADDFLTFRLEADSEIFIAIDKRTFAFPEWLKRDFRTIDKDVFGDAGTRLRVFKSRRVFPAGDVTLGGNFAVGTDIHNFVVPFMYAVFVKPTEEIFPYQQGDFISYTDPLGVENDLETFNYRIEAIDAAGNVSQSTPSGPVILDLHGHCKPLITDWFVAEGPGGRQFSRGTTNQICIKDPDTQTECVGFRDSDSLRFQAARGGTDLFGGQPPGDDGIFFFDSGWLRIDQLGDGFCHEFDLLPPDRGPNFVNGQEYFYRVRAKDVHGNLSAWSDTVSSIQDFFPPTDINALTAETEVFEGQDDGCIRLNWQPAIDQVSGVGSYEIYRSDDLGATFSLIDEIPSLAPTYCDTLSSIDRNIEFTYRVLAKDRVGNAIGLDETAQQVTLRALVGPSIEPDIDETFDCSTGLLGVNSDTVSIVWRNFDATDVSRYEARVVGPGGETFRIIDDAGATRAELPITGADGIYEIRLRAIYNSGEVTIFSNAVVVRKKTTLGSVQNLTAVQVPGPSGDVLLIWSHPDGDEILEFEIFAWPSGEVQPATPTVVLPGDSLTWTHSFAEGGVVAYQCNNYLVRPRDCFMLRSSNDPVVSEYSNRAPTFDRNLIEIAANNITVCWTRPSPRFKPDDSFTAEVVIYQDSVTAVPFFTGEVFNRTCFTFFDAPPMHNYIFQVRETILDDLQQACSTTFVSAFSDPFIIPLDNLPPSVSLEAQPLPVLPEESEGNVFVSWQDFSSPVVDDFVVHWTAVGQPVIIDSVRLSNVDTVLVEGLDISRSFEFSVTAIDFLGQRSVQNEVDTVSFMPRWVFTPKPSRLVPACFRDSVTVELDWVDEDLTSVGSMLGADSVFVELSLDPTFRFLKNSRAFSAQRSLTFHRADDFSFVNRQNDSLYVRARAKDRFGHFSPWSTTYPELGFLAGRFDDIPPSVVTAFVDSTKAPVFNGTDRVNVHLSWQDVSDNCSGTWFYEILRDSSVVARDTSRVALHQFIDRGVEVNENFLNREWRVHAVDSAGNRQPAAIGARIPIQVSPPDSAGCANDSTFCWNAATASVAGLQITYFLEGARFEELLGNPTTNVFVGPLTSFCTEFDVPWEQIFWRVKARVGGFESAWSETFFCELSTGASLTAIDSERSSLVPESFALRQNYPNPFNPTTTIEYAIPKLDDQAVSVLLELFNVAGQRIRTLVNTEKQPGEYAVVWDGRDAQGRAVSSGVYVYQIRARNFVASHKLILLK